MILLRYKALLLWDPANIKCLVKSFAKLGSEQFLSVTVQFCVTILFDFTGKILE